MQGFDLIRGTLMLLKTLHENPESGAVIHDPGRPVDLREQVRLAPKTKEQIDAAIAAIDAMDRETIEDRIMVLIEQRVDSADVSGTIEGLAESILEYIFP